MGYLLFEEIQEGAHYGPYPFRVTPEMVQKYAAAIDDFDPLFFGEGSQGGAVGSRIAHPTLAAAAVVDAYYRAFRNRPPGVVHTEQYLEFHGPIFQEDNLAGYLQVLAKEVSGGRKILKFSLRLVRQNTVVVYGESVAIWPDQW